MHKEKRICIQWICFRMWHPLLFSICLIPLLFEESYSIIQTKIVSTKYRTNKLLYIFVITIKVVYHGTRNLGFFPFHRSIIQCQNTARSDFCAVTGGRYILHIFFRSNNTFLIVFGKNRWFLIPDSFHSLFMLGKSVLRLIRKINVNFNPFWH